MTTGNSLTPVLQTVGIVAATLAAGTNLSTTIVVLPSLLHAESTTLARQFSILYHSGITPMASLSVIATTSFSILAYRAAQTAGPTSAGSVASTKRNLYLVAATASIGILPYTKLLMGGVINTLVARANEGKGGADVKGLVESWGRLNLGRGTMLLVGAVAGAWASLS
ncbi:hypothetical protein K491DRAFT_692708 [Lophiostoma macrostomum CBS 122681]|uniref:DUF1772-domain-containing protein n=1 Tax=Lophiostoma macrostomum CBS 122681 TaxID=1314788 RepID=A0A6A6TAM2_9PLEO|nr:hypothetical protein K491DRAFT_692708 [Lophiostoma macrostomum CBS 122681]